MLFAMWHTVTKYARRWAGNRAGRGGRSLRFWRLHLEGLESRAVPATFTVTSPLDAGPGTLRQAILDSNGQAGGNTIRFNLAGPAPHLISPLSPLPAATTPVTIDGATQPGFGDRAIVVLSGLLAGNANGLVLNADNSAIRYLDFESFAQAGILVTGSHDSLIADISGLDVTTNLALGNAVGVSIQGGTGNQIVPGPNTFPSVISGNSQAGIVLSGTSATAIHGDYIGTDLFAQTAVPNGDGIDDFGGNGDLISAPQGGGSRISGNNGYGIHLVNCTGTVVQSNFIGVDINLSRAIPNATGVFVDGGQGNIIGGPPQGAGNLISGNSNDGILIDGNADSTQVWSNTVGADVSIRYAIPNGTGIVVASGTNTLIGGPEGGEGNDIAGNRNDGLDLLDPSTGTVVKDNLIGTNPDGTVAIPNNLGIYISASGNMIGGHTNADANLVSGNTTYGIYLTGSNNVVSANEVGTVAGGLQAQPNAIGMYVSGSNNLLGGTDIGHTSNLFSGNLGNGLEIAGDNNLLENNEIGVNDPGRGALPNGQNGLYITGSNNTVGGIQEQAYNQIAGNTGDGIFIDTSGTGNLIEGNHIGVDDPGRPLPNGGNGIHIDGSNNTVGGLLSNEYNVIDSSGQNGVLLDVDATGNVIQNNEIGTQEFQYNNGNNGAGVYVLGSNNYIGGPRGLGNTIVYNGQAGVVVDGGTGNTITGNTIDYHPNGLGIELVNGGNSGQAFPDLTSAYAGFMYGSLTSTPDTTFTIDFYASNSPNPSGYGEGHYYLTSIQVTTDDSGYAEFGVYVGGGPWNSATATDPDGNTSPFSLSLPTAQAASPSGDVGALAGVAAPQRSAAIPVAPATVAPTEAGMGAAAPGTVDQGGLSLPDRTVAPTYFGANPGAPALAESAALEVRWTTDLEGDHVIG